MLLVYIIPNGITSHSVWSAWIEIVACIYYTKRDYVALRLECVDRNTISVRSKRSYSMSHSVWSAWIEIFETCAYVARYVVALRLECVDRNSDYMCLADFSIFVALRLECVDRNISTFYKVFNSKRVALRLECVDRNNNSYLPLALGVRSHSVWSAWIEISYKV